MIEVHQMRKRLTEPPEIHPIEGVCVRVFDIDRDISRWLELREKAFARERVGVRSWTAEEFADEFLSRFWWNPDHCWLAERSESAELLGSITLAERGKTPAGVPVVHWLAVLPSYRRCGIARLLLAHLERAVWDSNRREIFLETHARWHRAVAFYRACGYELCAAPG